MPLHDYDSQGGLLVHAVARGDDVLVGDQRAAALELRPAGERAAGVGLVAQRHDPRPLACNTG